MKRKVIRGKSYRKQIRLVHARYRRRIEGLRLINELARNPFPSNSKKLGEPCENVYRLRINGYRVVYEIDDEGDIIVIKLGEKIGPEFYEDVC